MLAIHNRYRQSGGEDVAFEAETRLLEEHGHRVERLVLENSSIPDNPSFERSARLALGTIWSERSATAVAQRVRRARADVVHVHNFFPLLSPSIYAAARHAGAAVVQTLHNYRLVCPVATLYRDGHVCEDCLGRAVAWPSVVHRCYRGSVSGSAAVAGMLAMNRVRGTWVRDVDLYLAVSETVRAKVVEGLLPADLVAVKPNFVPDPGQPVTPPGNHFLFVGRLAEDKGVETLVEAWRQLDPSIRLRVVGDGPLAPLVRAASIQLPNLTAVGRIPHDAVLGELRAAKALVFPSRWYEGMPLTIVEAFAAGRPVVASRLGTAGELVTDATGLLFTPGDAAGLAGAVSTLAADSAAAAALGSAARQVYVRDYTPAANYELLGAFYAEAIRRRRRAAERAALNAVRNARPT